MKVVFASSEVFPFAKTGGLADVCGALPIALEKSGIDVTVFLPHFRFIDVAKFGLERVNNQLSRATIGQNIDVFFIENNLFFGREGIYGDTYGDYGDNLQRFQFFSLKVLEVIKQLKLDVDIMHCHDWQSALIPVYLKTRFQNDPYFKKTKSILTIHNLAYQGIFPQVEFHRLGLDQKYLSAEYFEYFNQINLLKAAIVLSDRLTTVSEMYGQEILTKDFGCGLEEVLKKRKDKVTGIVNGIDYDIWNPQEDEAIVKTFSVADVEEGKLKNKQALQVDCGFEKTDKIPLFGFVGRLSHQKGMDLLIDWLKLKKDYAAQFVFQGVGDEKYAGDLRELASRHSKYIFVHLAYDEPTAHKIYAASDYLLMPSRYEPCGLSQLIAMHYGSIPIVYKTGGLADTVKPIGDAGEKGIVMNSLDQAALTKAFQQAGKIFEDKAHLKILRENGMNADFSWDHFAEEYEKLYNELM